MRGAPGRTLRALAAATLLVACCAPLALGQASPSAAAKTYWLRQFVGDVTLARLGRGAAPRLYVVSGAGVLAALRADDGALAWRKVMSEDEAVSRLELAAGRLVLLSQGGRRLRAFDAASGTLAWDAAPFADAARAGALPPAGHAAAGLVTFGSGASAVVAVALGGQVKVRLALPRACHCNRLRTLPRPPRSPVRASPRPGGC